jgi:hypothetical protein
MYAGMHTQQLLAKHVQSLSTLHACLAAHTFEKNSLVRHVLGRIHSCLRAQKAAWLVYHSQLLTAAFVCCVYATILCCGAVTESRMQQQHALRLYCLLQEKLSVSYYSVAHQHCLGL